MDGNNNGKEAYEDNQMTTRQTVPSIIQHHIEAICAEISGGVLRPGEIGGKQPTWAELDDLRAILQAVAEEWYANLPVDIAR